MKNWLPMAISAIFIGIILIFLELFITDWWEQFVNIPEKPKLAIVKIHNQRNNELQLINKITQLKQLINHNSPIKVSLWLGEYRQKSFNRQQKVIIAYEVQGNSGDTAYLTLLNISPKGQISKMFSEKIRIGKKYDGKLRPGEEYVKRRETYLETGQEYFKALVTSAPLKDWRSFINSGGGATQMNFWGTGEFMADVVD
jgi:multimeric flavodoxin WrbA